MKKTPQQFRRDNVKELFDRILKQNQIKLSPTSIDISESINDDFTTVSLLFVEESDNRASSVPIGNIKAKGFVDGLFLGLKNYYIDSYPTLKKIKLVDLVVNPITKKSGSLGSDARANVSLRVHVDKHGEAEFEYKSRSVVHSSFTAGLKAFEFYINCERTFLRIKSILKDAEARNRGDIAERCMVDLSLLTGVNTYG